MPGDSEQIISEIAAFLRVKCYPAVEARIQMLQNTELSEDRIAYLRSVHGFTRGCCKLCVQAHKQMISRMEQASLDRNVFESVSSVVSCDENLPEIIRRNLRTSTEHSDEQNAVKRRDNEHTLLKEEAEALRQSCFAEASEINDLGRMNKQLEAEMAQIREKYAELQKTSDFTLKSEIEALKHNIINLKAFVQFEINGSAEETEEEVLALHDAFETMELKRQAQVTQAVENSALFSLQTCKTLKLRLAELRNEVCGDSEVMHGFDAEMRFISLKLATHDDEPRWTLLKNMAGILPSITLGLEQLKVEALSAELSVYRNCEVAELATKQLLGFTDHQVIEIATAEHESETVSVECTYSDIAEETEDEAAEINNMQKYAEEARVATESVQNCVSDVYEELRVLEAFSDEDLVNSALGAASVVFAKLDAVNIKVVAHEQSFANGANAAVQCCLLSEDEVVEAQEDYKREIRNLQSKLTATEEDAESERVLLETALRELCELKSSADAQKCGAEATNQLNEELVALSARERTIDTLEAELASNTAALRLAGDEVRFWRERATQFETLFQSEAIRECTDADELAETSRLVDELARELGAVRSGNM